MSNRRAPPSAFNDRPENSNDPYQQPFDHRFLYRLEDEITAIANENSIEFDLENAQRNPDARPDEVPLAIGGRRQGGADFMRATEPICIPPLMPDSSRYVAGMGAHSPTSPLAHHPPPFSNHPYHSVGVLGLNSSQLDPQITQNYDPYQGAQGQYPETSSPANTTRAASPEHADEDKRRRNVAASARFRAKKKQREKALVQSYEELQAKVSSLEAELVQVKTENKWLRELVTGKRARSEDPPERGKEGSRASGEGSSKD